MPYLLIAITGSSIIGLPFLKEEIGPVSIFGIVVFLAACGYIGALVRIARGTLSLGDLATSERWLLLFFIVGVILFVLSACGVYRAIVPSEILYDESYMFRQAYYLYFIPAILLVSRSPLSYKMIDALRRHYLIAFILIYLFSFCLNLSFSLNMTATLCLGTILLLGRDRTRVVDCGLLAILLVTPLGVGGEQTQIILKMVLLVLFVSNNPGRAFRCCLYLMVAVILLCLVIANAPLSELGLEGNTVWRAMYWQSQIQQVLSTFGLGVGYGNSYATVSFASGDFTGIPFNPDSEYSRMEKIFLVGSHNSYVSILYRLGIIGFALFLMYHLQIAAESRAIAQSNDGYAYYAFLGSMVILAFNVGLESPMNLLTFVFSSTLIGMLSQRGKMGLAKQGERGSRCVSLTDGTRTGLSA